MSNPFLRVLRRQVLLVVGVAFGVAAYLTAVPTSAEELHVAFLPSPIFREEDADMVAAYHTRHRTRRRTHREKTSTSHNSKGRVRRESSSHRRQISRRLSRTHAHRRLSKKERKAMRKSLRLWKRHYGRAATKVVPHSPLPQTIGVGIMSDAQLGEGEGCVTVLEEVRRCFGGCCGRASQSDLLDDDVGSDPIDGPQRPTLEMGPETPLGVALTPVCTLLELQAEALEGRDVRKAIAKEVLKVYAWVIDNSDLKRLKADGKRKLRSRSFSAGMEWPDDYSRLKGFETLHYDEGPEYAASDLYAELRTARLFSVGTALENAQQDLLAASFEQLSKCDEGIATSSTKDARVCWDKMLDSGLADSLFEPRPKKLASTLQGVYNVAAQHYEDMGKEFNARVAGRLMYHLESGPIGRCPSCSVVLAFRLFSLALCRLGDDVPRT